MPVASALLPILVGMFLPAAAAQQSRAPSDPAGLSYMCEDLAPSNYLDHDTLAGFSIDLLKAMWARMHVPAQRVKVVPWARGYHTILQQPGQVLFSMSRTPERDTLFRWVGPIFTVRNVFVGRSGDDVRIRSLDEARKYRVGVVKRDVVEQELLGLGFDRNRLEAVSDLRQNFEKLRSGRIDLIAHSERSIQESLDLMKLDRADYPVKFVLSEARNYYAFSRSTSTALVDRFQRVLDSMGPFHRSLLARYRLAP